MFQYDPPDTPPPDTRAFRHGAPPAPPTAPPSRVLQRRIQHLIRLVAITALLFGGAAIAAARCSWFDFLLITIGDGLIVGAALLAWLALIVRDEARYIE